MEQLVNFSVDFLARSIANTVEAEEYYNEVYKNLEAEFLKISVASETPVQKTKKAKQAIDASMSSSSRKALVAAADKENVDRNNAMDSEEPGVLDSTAAGRPVRARRTKLANLRESLISGEKKKIRIKKEPVDKPAAKPKSPPALPEATVVIPETPQPEKRKSSDEANEEGAANTSSESNKKLDDSVELITKKPELVEVSDDETDAMPPPAVPPVKAGRAKKKATTTAASTASTDGPVKIKEEPVDEVLPKRSTRSKVAKKPTTTTTTTTSKSSAKSSAKDKEKEREENSRAEETFENLVPKIRNSSLANASTVSTETSVTTLAQKNQQKEQPPTVEPVAVAVIPEPTPPEPEKKPSKARTKSKKPVIDKVTKQVIPEAEPLPETTEVEPPVEDNTPVEEEMAIADPLPPPPPVTTTTAAVKTTKTSKKANNTSKSKQSTESVYEDAKSDSKLFSAKVSLEDMNQKSLDSMVQETVTQMDVEVTLPNVNNETFVAEPPVVRPVPPEIDVPLPSALQSPQLDSTFNVAPPPPSAAVVSVSAAAPQAKAKKASVAQAHDSIMTEDMSMAVDNEAQVVKQEPMESPPKKAAVPAKTASKAPSGVKKHNEIFNPFVQSPVKAKVDAYERHAKESKIPCTPKYVPVPKFPSAVAVASQPLPSRIRDNDTTPVKGIGGGGGLLGSTTSDTTGNKLAHMKKVLGKGGYLGVSGMSSSSDSARGSASSVSTVSSAKSMPRSNSSAEDAKRMVSQLQLAAEEKKKKREEKQRLAQANREKIEKEKKEHLDKLAKEREEKVKKLLLEKAEQHKQEKKKQAMARLAMENNQQMKIKEMQMKQKAIQGDAPGYSWELLRSEDGSDDEHIASKLPPPPEWSRHPLRTRLANQQAEMPSHIIDTLFGLKPMSPDLREIFPDIDPKLLKRNSSMIWKTPPRFSRMERP